VTFSIAKYAALFADEAREHLAAAGAALLELERIAARGEPAGPAVDAAFRAVHTVKGMSATMAYTVVERVAHEMESTLSQLRDGARTADPALVDALLGAADALAAAVDAAVGERPAPDVEAALLALGSAPAHPLGRPENDAPPVATLAPSSAEGLRVRVHVASAAALPGVRAFLVLQRARALGDVREVLPPESSLLAGDFDGALTLRLVPNDGIDAAEIERALLAVGELASVAIGDPRARAATVEHPVAVGPSAAVPAAARHVRIDAATLDALLDLAGELVTARGRLSTAASRIGDAALAGAVADVGRLVASLQEQVLESRLVPVAEVFDRMPRLVRDAARATAKRVELRTEGGEVGVDRAVLDALGDPLGHLLRNAVDHGIESAERRAAAGKPPTGRVTVRAVRERDAIAVAVTDDGGGVDVEAVLRRARSAGLVDASVRSVDDDQLLHLLASPGFSTASRVTSVSGRGVGVDAVVARVRALGGTVSLHPRPGAGTTWTLRLPLTLALARALLARDASGTFYALPLTHVRETLDLDGLAERTDDGRSLVRVRDELVPLVALGDVVASERQQGADVSSRDALARCTEAAIVEVGTRRVALAVETFVGQPELVVKRLPNVRGALRIFGGASILDGGAVALIVDLPALLSRITP
jgi:two-component system chemotaxis sensor kinase CheA